MSVLDLCNYLTNKDPNLPIQKVYLAAVLQDYEQYYMDIGETDLFIEELLKFQFDENEERIAHFITTLYNVLNRTNGKKNCLEIVGPPSSCKSLFITFITEAFINVGYCSKVNKWERFGLQDLTNVRVGVLDDANLDPAAKDQMLCILSGNKLNVSIKNQGDEIMLKTPIINISNKRLFVGAKWDERIERFNWRVYPVKIMKHPNPLYTFLLFLKYNCYEAP